MNEGSRRDWLIDRLRMGHAPGRRSAPGTIAAAIVAERGLESALHRGDHDLNPGLAPKTPLTQAAVLVPILDHGRALHVLLTRRAPHLNDHAGQISFPGGRIDSGDRDAAAAALREAREEVGLPSENVEILGRLDTYVTRTGYEVAPFVALVRPPLAYDPDPFEVAEVFEVPLDFFLKAENRRLDSRVYQGKRRHFHAFPFGDYYIWGATAGMIVNLVEVLTGEGRT